MNREAWQATDHGVTKESDMTKQLTPSLWTPQEWEMIHLPLCTSLSQRISLFVCNLL